MPGIQVRYVNDTPLQSTLRELRGLSQDGRAWVVLVLLSLIVGLVGPFGTYQAIALLPRLAYWAAIVLGTAVLGTLIAGFCERLLRPRLHRIGASVLAGAAAGPFIAATVALLNLAVFGPGVSVIDLLTLVVYCTLISSAVTLLSTLFEPRPPAAADVEMVPALLERLPRAQRGRILHLAVSDHYVDVTTDRGTSLVLIRLSDAIRETMPIAGIQVHRSHWVALDAVRRSVRQNGRPLLELETGTLVPVSRTYRDAVRSAGLLDG